MLAAAPVVVILVSGSRAESRAWSRILPVLRENPQLATRATVEHIDTFALVRSRSALPLRRRWFPFPADLAAELRSQFDTLLRDPRGAGAEFVLVGYRFGCKVIDRALVNELSQRERTELIARVRRAVFLSPSQADHQRMAYVATIGALLLGFAGTFATKLYNVQNPSMEAILVVLGYIPALLLAMAQFFGWNLRQRGTEGSSAEFRDRFVRGSKHTPGTWPIPLQTEDVPNLEKSSPRDVEDVVTRLIHPVSHPNVYEIRLEEVIEQIKPVNASPGARLSDKTNHVSHWSRKIEFQPFDTVTVNSGLDLWVLSLTTSGVIQSVDPPNEKNEWNSSDEWDFKTNRKRYQFRFRPLPGRTYELRLKVLGPHGRNHRDSHSHFRADANYERHRRILDLREMLAAGYRFRAGREPRAWFIPGALPSGKGPRELDSGHCTNLDDTYRDQTRTVVPNTSNEPGVFVWEVLNVRNGGILAYEYDWREEEITPAADAPDFESSSASVTNV